MKGYDLFLGFGSGMLLGTAFGILTDRMLMGFALGGLFGVSIALLFWLAAKNRDAAGDDEEDGP